eukprot:CAMPEP_0201538938 /NCGR_PEP_ID=MMETSP0161_2-20130828/68962_1 /ASSEMBLY_ACC=CAM_ASM_000251 /TAXON_ID=180227 /ORGANISM="Neoparamoeba aestuarina, Strain SoJaBio B1-5/56/2" /LENGTH=581 /DNA_ID=CAMNT_0047946035 /DNA_START=56 /DNA_END=1801 /DNA_ORIENTATION=-
MEEKEKEEMVNEEEEEEKRGNFFVENEERLAQITLPTPGARDLISSDNKTLLQKALNKPSGHIPSEKREGEMTKGLKKLEKKKEEPKDTKKEKVLVVEDNKLVQKVLNCHLTNLGYVKIFMADNGEEGVKLFEQEHPDIILLDLFMPVMDGGECCAKIRKLPLGANVPIIGVTAHDDQKEIGKFLDNGMNGVLTKPVKKSQLERVMNRFVGDAAGQAVYTKENWMAVVSKKQPPPAQAKVLVVEDNKLIQKVMEVLLTRLKFNQDNITFCSNGKEAIAAISETPFDIIFMDLYMPEMDGVEATAEIRKHSSGANIPIIACTGHAIESDTKLCVRYGMNDLILKPVKEKALVTILRRYGFSVSLPKKKKPQQEQRGPVSNLMRDASFANMTDLNRQRAISNSDFRDIAAPNVKRENSQDGGLPLIATSSASESGDDSEYPSLLRTKAASQAHFPIIHMPDEEKIDLTGVRLTKMMPVENDDDEADVITFTSEDIRSVFRKHSSIFIEGALDENSGKVPDVFGDGEESDAEPVPFSLQNILQRNDLDKGSKLDMMWNDYLLTEGSFAGGDLSDNEDSAVEAFE